MSKEYNYEVSLASPITVTSNEKTLKLKFYTDLDERDTVSVNMQLGHAKNMVRDIPMLTILEGLFAKLHYR